MTKTLIIAEAGVNHNGNLETAKQLIDIAAQSGADYVKFQTYKSENLVTKDAKKAEYQKTSAGKSSQFEMLKNLELSKDDHYELIDYCKNKNIGFLSTPFDLESAQFLFDLNLDFFKVSSGDINNYPLLSLLGSFSKDVIISSGLSYLSEVEKAVLTLENAGLKREQIKVLHCSTEYPTPFEDVNLKAMETIHRAFNVEVGYSDHTLGIEVPIAAVSLGAKVIEKHFTLNRDMDGPDHAASLNPDELITMVKMIRNIEKALGHSIKRPAPSELKNLKVVRKSIVAVRDISEGEEFSPDNISLKRPGDGLGPEFYDFLLGQKASRSYKTDNFIELKG